MFIDLMRDGIAAVRNGQNIRGRELLHSALGYKDIPSGVRANLLMWFAEAHDDVVQKLAILHQADQVSPFDPKIQKRIASYSQYLNERYDWEALQKESAPPHQNGSLPPLGEKEAWYPTAMSGLPPEFDEDKQMKKRISWATTGTGAMPDVPKANNEFQSIPKPAPSNQQTAVLPHIDKARSFVQRRAQDKAPPQVNDTGLWVKFVDSSEAIAVVSGDVATPEAGQKSRHNWYLYTIIWLSGFLVAALFLSLSIGLRDFMFSLVPEAIGIVFTVGILERMASRRAIAELKRQLIHQTGSRSNETAKSAVDRIRAEGWLAQHRILVGQNLRRANLEGAYLKDADLSRANLEISNLNGAYLLNANLSRCKLTRAIQQ